MQLRLTAGLAAGLVVLALPAAAAAAPVTVQLRIEGPQHTLFEGPVTTDVRAFHFSGDPTGHDCDNSPPAAAPEITRGAVVTAAEETAGLVTHGTWSASLGSPSFSDIDGESVAFDAATNRFLVEYLDERESQVGSCAEPVHDGDRVLYAYGTGSERLLALSGPATARTDTPVALRVTDPSTGAPVAGASVDGRLSGADGTVAVGPLSRGPHEEQATMTGAIRSNRVTVCATDGADGACGTTTAPPAPRPVVTPDRTAPAARLLAVRDHQVFSRRRGPRSIRISVPADPSTVKKVDLRLTRQAGRRCWYFSGRRARFVRSRCMRRVYFSVPVQPRISYLLPRRLRHGRYVLDVVAVDGAGNREALARGRSRVVFSVR
jgi:hypothetical protein